MIDLDGIRKRAASDNLHIGLPQIPAYITQIQTDVDDLLAYVDELLADAAIRGNGPSWMEEAARQQKELRALRAAAGKVTCDSCKGDGIIWIDQDCPECSDLRAILQPAPQSAPAHESGSTPPA